MKLILPLHFQENIVGL